MSALSGARRVWTVLKPPPATPDGTMSLYDHLRELRYRVIVIALAVAVTSSLAALFYRPILNLVLWPWDAALVTLKAWNPQVATQIVNRDAVRVFVPEGTFLPRP